MKGNREQALTTRTRVLRHTSTVRLAKHDHEPTERWNGAA